MADDNPIHITQMEVTLAALREPAMRKLLDQGVASAYTSQAKRTERGLEVESTDNKTKDKSKIIVSGTASIDNRLFHLDQHAQGDVTVTNGANGKVLEKDHIDFSSSDIDHLYNQDYKVSISHKRHFADDGRTQTAETKTDHVSPGKNEADYKIHDSKYGDLTLNETITSPLGNRKEYRSVLRDSGGKVLGIIDQVFDLDGNGDPTSVYTSARKPAPEKK
jgi:hypothetical protein